MYVFAILLHSPHLFLSTYLPNYPFILNTELIFPFFLNDFLKFRKPLLPIPKDYPPLLTYTSQLTHYQLPTNPNLLPQFFLTVLADFVTFFPSQHFFLKDVSYIFLKQYIHTHYMPMGLG